MFHALFWYPTFLGQLAFTISSAKKPYPAHIYTNAKDQKFTFSVINGVASKFIGFQCLCYEAWGCFGGGLDALLHLSPSNYLWLHANILAWVASHFLLSSSVLSSLLLFLFFSGGFSNGSYFRVTFSLFCTLIRKQVKKGKLSSLFCFSFLALLKPDVVNVRKRIK